MSDLYADCSLWMEEGDFCQLVMMGLSEGLSLGKEGMTMASSWCPFLETMMECGLLTAIHLAHPLP